MYRLKDKLPNTLHELLDTALTDLIKCENDPKYRIDMDEWYSSNGHCSVCLAGASLAKTCGFNRSKTIIFGYNDLSEKIIKKMCVINHLRMGNIDFAYEQLYKKDLPSHINSHANVISYPRSSREFKRDMRKLVKYLKSKGI